MYKDKLKKIENDKLYYLKNREKIIKRACEYQKLNYIPKDKTNDKYARNTKGQFIYKNGNALYKRKQKNGINTSEHRIIYEKYYGKIPAGYIIHHIDGDKLNNSIENLKAMSQLEHNRIHKHTSWNKGLKYHRTVKLGEYESRKKKVRCVELNIIFNSVKDAAKYINRKTQSISRCLHNSKYSAGGFHFELA